MKKLTMLWYVLLLCGSVAQANFVNTYTLAGITWNLSADMVAGTYYNNNANWPSTTSVVFSGLDPHGDPTIYYNMTITGFGYESGNHSTDIIIPGQIGWDSHGSYGVGYGPVQYISSDAFYNRDVTTVDVPTGILDIRLPCFRKCGNLTAIRVTNGSGVELTNPAGLKNYSSQDGVLYNADKTRLIKYPEGKEGDIFVVPATVTNLATYCFADTSLKWIYCKGDAPHVSASITNTVFSGSSSLKGVLYPYGAKGWPEYWCGVPTYSVIWTSEDEPIFFVDDRNGEVVLTRVELNGACDVTIPDCVTSIGNYAFYYCLGLTSVTIPDSVTSTGVTHSQVAAA